MNEWQLNMSNWFFKRLPVTVTPVPQKEVEHSGPPYSHYQGSSGLLYQWTSVEQQVPEFAIRVLVHSKAFGVITGCRSTQNERGNHWDLNLRSVNTSYSGYYSNQQCSDVTHWMTMPSPPQGTK